MSPAGGRTTSGAGPPFRWGRPVADSPVAGSLATGLAVALLVAALLALGGTAGASVTGDAQFQTGDNDTAAPTVGNLSAVDGTTMELAIEDDTDVDEDSIDPADLRVSVDGVEDVTVDDDGRDATVTLRLAESIDTETVSVRFVDGATVRDVNGNERDVGGVDRWTDGMDTVEPRIERFAVDPAGGTAVNVTVGAHEPLDSATVAFAGPEEVTVPGNNYTASDDGRTLSATVDLPAAGDYRATLQRATDAHGNAREVNRSVDVATDERPPDAAAGIDFAATDGRTVTFDGSRSNGTDPIESHVWALGDGTEATGERVTHRYRPGTYTVTLTVTDADGDVGTDRLVVDVRGDGGVDTVGDGTVTFGSADAPGNASAIVDVAAPGGEAVRVARGGANAGPVVRTDAVALSALTITLESERRYGLAIQAEGPETVADVRPATGASPVGALTVVHDVPDAAVANATLTVAVDRARVDDADIDPADVAVYRHHNESWARLETNLTGTTNGTYRYRAASPGLSRFAVATGRADGDETNASDESETETGTEPGPETATATATPTPATGGNETTVTVTGASLNRSSVDPGQPVGVNATVTNDGDGGATYTAGLVVDGEVVDTAAVAVPAGGNQTARLAWTPAETGEYALAVNGTAAGSVSVGSDGGGGIVGAVLGALPLGLVQTVVTYLGGLVVALFLALKAVALYLGY